MLPWTSSKPRTLVLRIKRLDLDTSHFLGQGWRKGLKERLIREGLKQRKCEMCGRAGWRDRPIPLELDHINGRRQDNRLQNLRILCPNCHAQTDTYRGRNIGIGNLVS
jgi:5-methylcytosine-specific restriction endonuclease McrA